MKFPFNYFILLTTLMSACQQNTPENLPISKLNVSTISNSNDSLRNDEVCMVNDRYMGEKQIPVVIDGITYYGCCERCKESLTNEENYRMAVDPYSKKQVNKARAFIVLSPAKDQVLYFENRYNYEQSVKRNNPEH